MGGIYCAEGVAGLVKGEETSSDALAMVSAAMAVALSRGLNADEVNLLGSFLASVSQVMALIAVQREAEEQKAAGSA